MWKQSLSWKSTILFIILSSIIVWFWNWNQCRKDTKHIINVAEKNGEIMSASFQRELWLLDWNSVTGEKMRRTRLKMDIDKNAANEISIDEKPEEEDIKNEGNVTRVERSVMTTAVGAAGAAASGGDEENRGPAARDLPWFMTDGSRRPLPAVRSRKTGRRLARIWPQEAAHSDRITDQLMFVPPLPAPGAPNTQRPQRFKKILIYYTINRKRHIRKEISLSKCPVNTCTITYEKEAAPYADVIVFKNYFDYRLERSSLNQVWVHYAQNVPRRLTAQFNWTATFRRDSDIVVPHAKWVYYDEAVQQNYRLQKNYTEKKSKKIVWFSKTCLVPQYQLQYVKELQKYIDVEMYECGIKSPQRVKSHLKLLSQDYKFLIIFETLNCAEYITRDFYENGLRYGMVPVVMGARPEDYARNAPYRSYIHVDDFESARDLAEYLLRLDADDDLYNSYFRWKGTGEFINTYFFCRLCAMLHDDFPVKSYNISEWWNNNFACVKQTWRNSSFDIL